MREAEAADRPRTGRPRARSESTSRSRSLVDHGGTACPSCSTTCARRSRRWSRRSRRRSRRRATAGRSRSLRRSYTCGRCRWRARTPPKPYRPSNWKPEISGRVFHRVADAQAVVVVVEVARRREHAAEVVVLREALHEIDDRIVLAAERHGAVRAAREADDGLAAEFARGGRARRAMLKPFSSWNSAAGRRDRCRAAPSLPDRLPLLNLTRLDALLPFAFCALHVRDARIGDTVQRDAALRARRRRARPAVRSANERICFIVGFPVGRLV